MSSSTQDKQGQSVVDPPGALQRFPQEALSAVEMSALQARKTHVHQGVRERLEVAVLTTEAPRL